FDDVAFDQVGHSGRFPARPLVTRGIVAGVDQAAQFNGSITRGGSRPTRELSNGVQLLNPVDPVINEEGPHSGVVNTHAEAGGLRIIVPIFLLALRWRRQIAHEVVVQALAHVAPKTKCADFWSANLQVREKSAWRDALTGCQTVAVIREGQ